MSAAPILTILRNGEQIKSQALEGESVLGRGEDCVIRLDDRAISRQHAVFRPTFDGVQVEKKSEFAPLVVNGLDCTSALLKEGDVISIGPYLMRLTLQKEASKPTFQPAQNSTPKYLLEHPEIASVNPPPQALQSMPLDLDSPSERPNDELALVEETPNADSVGEQSSLSESADFKKMGSEAGDVAGGFPSLEAVEPGIGEGTGLLQLQMGDAQGLPDLAGNATCQPITGVLGVESASDGPTGMIGDEDKTRPLQVNAVTVRLFFEPGAANVTEYELEKDEVSLGRDKACDVVLNDKKASRKHAVIKRVGFSFVVKDLGSANGTFVNGIKVDEQALDGDDRIKIGNVEFQFKASSADYSVKAKDFMPVPAESSQPISMPMPSLNIPSASAGFGNTPRETGGFESHGMPSSPVSGMLGSYDHARSTPQPHDPYSSGSSAGTPGGGFAGVPGMGAPIKSKKGGLMEKFRALPPGKQKVYALLSIALFYFLVIDEDSAPIKKKPKNIPKPSASSAPMPRASMGPVGFESLSPKDQAFVETQHELAFTHYKNRDFDNCLSELNSIFALVNDYKDSREIERYAIEGRQRLAAFEEERKKKLEEDRLKQQIAALVSEVSEKMTKKQFEVARELFPKVLELDPENTEVAVWRKEIADYEESLLQQEQVQDVLKKKNQESWKIFSDGMALKNRGKFHSAIAVFKTVGANEAPDRRPASKAKAMIQSCKDAIRDLREPHLAEGKRLEDSGELSPAFKEYKKATEVDSSHPAGFAGMDRIRKTLHDRAKVFYTEAILAESYSDFVTARKKYRECLDIAPDDDIYHERATRKLARWFKKDDEAPSQ